MTTIDDLVVTDPTTVLPHRSPFLFVDAVTGIDVDGQRVRGTWTPVDEPFFAGHFPGAPIVPGVLLIEALAQLGAYAILSGPKHAGRTPMFGGIERARFRRTVHPGERVDLEVELTQLSARGGRGRGVASVDGVVACEVDLLVILVAAPKVSTQ